MSLLVLNIECLENKIVKELGVYKDGQTVGYSFVHPKKFELTFNVLGVQSIFMESFGAAVTKNILNFKKKLKIFEASETEVFAKDNEKCKILSDFWELKIINFDDYACPKNQHVIFKDKKKHDWRCSSYPF